MTENDWIRLELDTYITHLKSMGLLISDTEVPLTEAAFLKGAAIGMQLAATIIKGNPLWPEIRQ